MSTPLSPPQRQGAIILVLACVAFAFLSVSCGGGGAQTEAVTTPTTLPVSLSSTSLSFGSQPVDTASTAQTITLTNTSAAAVSLSLTFTGANASDFAETDTCGNPVVSGANCTIVMMFTPTVSGARTAGLSVVVNTSGAPQTVSLSGAGAHDVILTWSASTTPGVMGYDAFRGTASCGENSTPLNSTPIPGTTYVDVNVTAGTTYYYVVTAIGSNGVTQSPDSNEASATVPSP